MELSFDRTADREIGAYAAENGYAILTKDTDFQQLSLLLGAPPKVIWLRIGNSPTRSVLQLLAEHLDDIAHFLGSSEATLLALGRLFAQPSIGYASRNFDFAITTRLCYLDHDRTESTMGHPNLSDAAYSALQDEIAHGRMLVEPGFVLRTGTRAVKLQLQYAHSANLGRPLSMLEDNISIGLQLNINNSFQKRQRVRKERF